VNPTCAPSSAVFGPPSLLTKIKISYFSNFRLSQATNKVMILATLNDHLDIYTLASLNPAALKLQKESAGE
jgi:hypothetical protein